MNIGIFTDTYYPEVNGVATSTMELKNELERQGNTVYIFTVTNPNVTEKEINVYRMASVPFVFFKERRISFDIMTRWFKTIEDLDLDVIHTQTEFNVGQIGRRAAEKLNIPHIHTYHTIYEEYTHYLKVPGNAKLKSVIRKLSRHCCNQADEVIVPTEKVKKLLLGYGVRKPLIVQPTGVDLRKFNLVSQQRVNELKSEYCLNDNNHVMISVGRLSKEKNTIELITFLKQLDDPEARLIIVGDGPEREAMQEYAKECGLSKYVFFTGEVEWKYVQNYYAIADVFVGNSTSETQGLTYIEALAAGKPLLVRKDECQRNFLTQGENGYYFTEYEDFAEHYKSLFADSNYQKMGTAAYQSVSKCGAEAFGKSVLNIYAGLIEQNQSKHQKREGIYGKVQSIAG